MDDALREEEAMDPPPGESLHQRGSWGQEKQLLNIHLLYARLRLYRSYMYMYVAYYIYPLYHATRTL